MNRLTNVLNWNIVYSNLTYLFQNIQIHIGNEKYLVLRNYLPKDSSQTFLNGIQTGLGKSDPIKYFVRNLKSPISIMKEERRK